jgi:hypothetical protein
MAASPPSKPPRHRPHEPVAPESGTAAPGGGDGVRPAGRIVHDDRGNAVWNWGDANRSDTTSRVLKRLEVPDLQIEGQDEPARHPVKAKTATGMQPTRPGQHAPKSQGRTPIVDAGGGYNPYNLTVPVKKPSAATKPIPPKGSGRR